MQSAKKVWVIGDASVDLVPDTDKTYLKCPGGASANVTACIARQGGNCGFIGCLGDDDAGQFLKNVLQKEGADVTQLRLDAHLTSAVLIVNLTPDGERSFTYLVKPSADIFVCVADLPIFQPGEWFYFSSIGLTDSPAREACLEGARRMRAVGGQVMFDVNLRESMWRDASEIPALIAQSVALASICKVSADELCRLGNVARWQDARYLLRDMGCDTTVISLGAAGAYLVCPQGEQHFPAPQVPVIDTTGAGDAFVGGLLFHLSQYKHWGRTELSGAIRHANACGALVVTAKGAMTALPYPQQLNDFLAVHPCGSDPIHS